MNKNRNWFVHILAKLYTPVRTLTGIRETDLDSQSKSKISSTWWNMFYLNKRDTREKKSELVGFNYRYVDESMFKRVFAEVFLQNEYFFRTDNPKPFILDCGSNIGLSIAYFKMLYPDCQIVAFEPGEYTFKCAQENVKNNFADSVEIHNLALSAQEGTIDFFYDEEKPGSTRMSIVEERSPQNKREVKTSPLSKFIDRDVDFLKMDIEGAEFDVIEEMIQSGAIKRVKQMVIEYHHHIKKEVDDFSVMLKMLEDSGFGYHLDSYAERPWPVRKFQDIVIYAYQK